MVLGGCVVAVGLLMVARERSHTETAALGLEIDSTSRAGGSTSLALLGEAVAIRAPRATAIWVYREETLIMSCPGVDCPDGDGASGLTFEPVVARPHRVIALSGPLDLTSTGHFDSDILSARARGATLEVRLIDVVARRQELKR